MAEVVMDIGHLLFYREIEHLMRAKVNAVQHVWERLWRMQLNRRIGAGRLCEIFGAVALEADRFSRRLGMHRSAAQDAANLSTNAARVLNAYSRGVNAFIEHNNNKLPVEFTILGL